MLYIFHKDNNKRQYIEAYCCRIDCFSFTNPAICSNKLIEAKNVM